MLAAPAYSLQRLAERQVLGLAVRRQAGRVGRQESERRLLVLAVLGEVEVHLADEVPGRVQAPEELLDGGLRFGQLGGEGLTISAQSVEHDGGRQVLGAEHHRSGSGQRLDVLGRRGGSARCSLESGLLHTAVT